MKKKMKMKVKAILSLVLVLAMTLSSFNVTALLGNSMNEVEAADLTPITWTDFNGISFGQNIKGDSDLDYSYTGTSLNNTSFEGDIKIAEGTGFRYGGAAPHYFGMALKVVDGQLQINGHAYSKLNGSEGTLYTCNAADYGVGSTFAGARFTLRIDMYDIAADNLTAKTKIYVNGIQVGEEITIQASDAAWTTKIGSHLGAGNGLSADFVTYKTEEAGSSLTKITWTDFNGISFGQNIKGDSDLDYSYTGTSLNNTSFEGDIKIAEGTGLRYAGAAPHYFGMALKVVDGQLQINGHAYSKLNGSEGTLYTCNAADYGVGSTFAGARFTLRIDMYDIAADNLTAKTKIYVNGIQVGEEITIQASDAAATTKLGSHLGAGNGLSADFVTYKTVPALTKITWTDFNGISFEQNIKGDADVDYGYSGTSLNNTSFEGDIKIAEGTGLRYAGAAPHYFGMALKVVDGKLQINGHAYSKLNGSEGTLYTCNAADYGVGSTFAGARFTLRIDMYDISEDNLTAKSRIFVNGVQVGEEISIQASDAAATTKLGSHLGAGNGLSADFVTYKTVPALTKITWTDFNGISFGQNIKGDADVDYGYSGTSLNNTSFEGDIKIAEGTGLRYAGAAPHYFGMALKVVDGQLQINGHAYSKLNGSEGTLYTCDAADYEVGSTFANTRFTLRIDMYDISEDNLTAKSRIFVNGKQVGEEISIQASDAAATTKLGSHLGAGNGLSADFWTYKTTIPFPTGLDELSWEEFGYTGSVMNENDGVLKSASHLTDLDNTVFNGDIGMANNAWIRYGVGSDGNGGGIFVSATETGLGVSLIQDGAAITSYTADPADYGVDSFVDTKFNLKITAQNINSDPKFGVWVNDVLVGDLFETKEQGLTYGTYLMMSYGVTPVSHRTTAPTGLAEIHFADWKEDVAVDGKLTNLEISGSHPTQSTLIGSSLYEVVNFQDTESAVGLHLLAYGGMTTNSWLGLRISLNGANMQVQCNDGSEIRENFTVDPQKAGVGTTFRGVEFSWKIDIVQLGNHVLVYMTFNDQLYNDAPFVLHDFAGSMSNTIEYNSADSGYEDKCWVKLGPATKTLPELYHNLSKGAFILPSGATQLEQREGNDWKVISVVTFLDAVGDYKVSFNDGVSDYIQEVVLTSNEAVSAKELVRALKLKQGAAAKGDYANGAFRACDKNYNDTIDTSDITDIRSILLGTYKEEDTMKVSGFFGPTGILIQDETYKQLRATGVNHIIETGLAYTDDAISRYHVYQELAYAQKYGMTVTVQDKRLIDMADNGETITTDIVTAKTGSYDYYQSFAGLFIKDEPYSATYPRTTTDDPITKYSSLAKAINGAGIEGWSNVFGGSDDFFYRAKKYGYYNYLNEFVTSYDMSFLSFTYYPFWNEYPGMEDASVETSQNYFTNLALVKDVATAKGIPFRTFVQGGEGFEYDPDGNYTEAQFKWNANIGLTFGSKAVQYFPLVHPESLKNYSNGECASGLIDSEGNQTKFGQWATSMNKQVAAIDDVLMNATNDGFMSTGGKATTVAANTIQSITMNSKYWLGIPSGDEKIVTNTIHSSYAGATVTATDTTYGAFTGCFTLKDGRHAMYIVNFSDANANTITVSFDSSKTVTTVLNGEKETTTGTTITKTLGAGEAVLVVY